MIYYILDGHDLNYEVQTAIQIFYPNKHYYQTEEISKDTITVKSILNDKTSRAEVYDCGNLIDSYEFEYDINKIETLKDKKRLIKEAIYNVLSHITGYSCPWGMLTGIRPAKTVNEIIDKGFSSEYAFEYLTQKYKVTEKKARLAIDVALAERKYLNDLQKNNISLYIGIPFCPTRCLYCSFAAFPLDRYMNKVDSYIDALIKELEFLGQVSKDYKLKNIYIGGGTPTSLNEEQLEKLLFSVENIFDLSSLNEYTVEAGRPDTITRQKLKIIKKFDVNRISINPQTMNQKTLDLIGRQHSVEDIFDQFSLAREEQHNNINMDIILGLPKENEKDVENTWNMLQKLDPDSITVHNLAIKRASRLKEEFENYSLTDTNIIENMLDISYSNAVKMGMKPYYMYRQKNMVGSFENLGYAKPGKESIYNIEIMEETQTILGAGAGATTKIVNNETKNIERVFNVKNVDDYINRIDEMIQRKKDGII